MRTAANRLADFTGLALVLWIVVAGRVSCGTTGLYASPSVPLRR